MSLSLSLSLSLAPNNEIRVCARLPVQAEDTGIVRCALGRIGCTYEAPAESRAEAPYTSDGRDLACTSGKKNDDFGRGTAETTKRTHEVEVVAHTKWRSYVVSSFSDFEHF